MVHVGVLSPVTGGYFFGGVMAGVVREIASLGGHVTLVQTLDAGQSSDAFTPATAGTLPVAFDSIDGFVTIAWATPTSYLDELRASGKPVVVVSNDLGNIDACRVVIDNKEGVLAAVDHLVGHGHTRIGFVGNIEQSDMRERIAAYQAGMAAHGLDTTGLHFPIADHVETGGRSAAPSVAAAIPGCTAVITSTDRVAIGLIEGLDEFGLRVPQDLAIVGFDDAEAGWFASPPLATVRQRFDELGALAARLLVQEVRGQDVEHRVYIAPANFIPRGSCGCGPRSTGGSTPGIADGKQLVAAVLAAIGLGPEGEPPADGPTPTADLDALDAVIAATLKELYRPTSAPEEVTGLSETFVTLLGDIWARAREAGHPWAPALQYAVVRITTTLTQLQMVSGLRRVNRLSVSFDEQYDVGMSLLGRVGTDPADLSWLEPLSVKAGCLGLWDDSPRSGRLRVAGVFDRSGALDADLDSVVSVPQFPPWALLESADPGASEVCYVIPVRGSNGDHGFLALIGTVETEFGGDRATYDHWAALLGAALREKGLLEDVRRSEERYAFAARAANDGLWEYDVRTREIYLSPRCRDLLDLDADPDHATWIESAHPEDREPLVAALAEAGARPDTPVEVEYRVLRRDGTATWLLLRAFGVAAEGSVARLVGSLSDISHRKELEDRLRQAALFDALTGLPNRRLFLDRLAVAIEQPRRRPGARFAVFFLDLDGFKLVNDSLGHLAGDQLLTVVAARLRDQIRSVDTAARFGGDEFAVLLTDPIADELLVVAKRIQESISVPITLGEQEFTVTASIGIAASETGYTDPEDVLRDADIAMYTSKEAERGTATLFDPRMHERAVTRLRDRTELVVALDQKQFVVHYQPVVALDGSALTRFEALVRWQHPVRGLCGPGEFLPAMIDNRSIVDLGHLVLDEVCRQITAWRDGYDGPLAVSVNVSHREFWTGEFVRTVLETLERHGVPAECLILEITESVIVNEPEAAREKLTELQRAGIRVHIDDFGTGQSSLHALRTLPVDALKIDGSFIAELVQVARTDALVRTIIAMGESLGIDVIAECVETEQQAARLREMGCGSAQGWLYARALPPGEARELLGTPLSVASGDAAARRPAADRATVGP
jgi:diguanylate cyclase (GGDEF)-like protein/PAS domain S-box-containing protein